MCCRVMTFIIAHGKISIYPDEKEKENRLSYSHIHSIDQCTYLLSIIII
jgi:hypothetical protein